MQLENLNYKEAAQFLGLPVGTLYALVWREAIPHIRLGGRLVRFSRSELQAWLDSHRVSPRAQRSGRAIRAARA